MSNKSYSDEVTTGCLAVFGIFAGVGLLILLGPWIGFWMAYFGGWICKITIGGTLCHALNVTFDTNRFTPDLLPWIAATLGWIGGYFKSIQTKTSSK